MEKVIVVRMNNGRLYLDGVEVVIARIEDYAKVIRDAFTAGQKVSKYEGGSPKVRSL